MVEQEIIDNLNEMNTISENLRKKTLTYENLMDNNEEIKTNISFLKCNNYLKIVLEDISIEKEYLKKELEKILNIIYDIKKTNYDLYPHPIFNELNKIQKTIENLLLEKYLEINNEEKNKPCSGCQNVMDELNDILKELDETDNNNLKNFKKNIFNDFKFDENDEYEKIEEDFFDDDLLEL